MTVKTYEGWKGSLHKYLEVGDIVDEQIKDHFVNVMPPRLYRQNIIQMGEPYDHVNGKAVYATIIRVNGQWTYKGTCHYGEIEHKENNY